MLSWQISNTLDADYCIDALQLALAAYGRPEIFNTDQGYKFTSESFTSVLQAHSTGTKTILLEKIKTRGYVARQVTPQDATSFARR